MAGVSSMLSSMSSMRTVDHFALVSDGVKCDLKAPFIRR